MTQEPYRSARRVFWTMDNGSSHRGQACIDRIREQWPTIVPVHTPVHASWLNQVEIYFSILQRKALTPNDFPSLEALQERLLGFARYYEAIAQPFEWKFTRKDLDSLLQRIDRAHTANLFSRWKARVFWGGGCFSSFSDSRRRGGAYG